MTLRRFVLALTPATRASAGLAVLALAGIGISTANTEAVVTQRFAAALEANASTETASLGTDRALVSGSEAYWLEKQRHDNNGAALEPAAWSAPVAGLSIGDRITISAGKTERVLKVIAMTEIEPSSAIVKASGASNGNGAIRQVAVTCRDVHAPDTQSVTFIVPADTVQGPAKTARAL